MTELFFKKMNLNEIFINYVQKFMIHEFYEFDNLNALCMIMKLNDSDFYCIKNFLKQFYFKTVVN